MIKNMLKIFGYVCGAYLGLFVLIFGIGFICDIPHQIDEWQHPENYLPANATLEDIHKMLNEEPASVAKPDEQPIKETVKWI